MISKRVKEGEYNERNKFYNFSYVEQIDPLDGYYSFLYIIIFGYLNKMLRRLKLVVFG